jgi:hypothetical protein
MSAQRGGVAKQSQFGSSAKAAEPKHLWRASNRNLIPLRREAEPRSEISGVYWRDGAKPCICVERGRTPVDLTP